jgi:hypothetical protein
VSGESIATVSYSRFTTDDSRKRVDKIFIEASYYDPCFLISNSFGERFSCILF